MIQYKRQESHDKHDKSPRAVMLITDDANAEMASIQDIIFNGEFEFALPADREEDGNFHILIPGEVVGEFADFAYGIDNGELEHLIEIWNQEIRDELENNG